MGAELAPDSGGEFTKLTVNVDQIIIGAGNLYIAAPGDSYYGGFEGIARGTLDTNGSHVGATMDGVEVQYEPDYTDIVIDQLKDAAAIFQNGYRVTVRTNIGEATLRNLQMAWGLPSGGSGGAYNSLQPVTGSTPNTKQRLNLPIPADDPVERRLVIYGHSPQSTAFNVLYRKYFCRRAIAVDTSSHALKRAEATMFPVAFRVLADPNYSNAEYGYLEDEQG